MALRTIRQLIEGVDSGQIRIPAFQRGFVWDEEAVAFLMDSIYKGYPFGSLLFWRTKESLESERMLGPFKLPERDPDYPLDYVLDGQQRLTSLFGVFQTSLEPTGDDLWTNVYFDLNADADAQESQFVVLSRDQIDEMRHFPLRVIFDSVGYRKATERFDEPELEVLDNLQTRFKETQVPVQSFETEDKAMVAIIFERVNRQGVPLDTLQLLTAWTWSQEFVLHEQFENLKEELAEFGFSAVGQDTNLVLRCCAAVLAGDAKPETLMSLNGAEVRKHFVSVENGIRGAVDFLRKNLNVHDIAALPFTTLLVPLSALFAAPEGKQVVLKGEQYEQVMRWIWRTCFSRRYSSGVLRNLNIDVAEMSKLRDGKESQLGAFRPRISPEFFLENSFRINTVNSKTLVLMLAQRGPRSFISGSKLDLAKVLQAYNRNEFHHIFPQKYLKSLEKEAGAISALANICFLSRAENNKLGGHAPADYRKQMPTADADLNRILDAALAPNSMFADDVKYENWLEERARLLAKEANMLMDLHDEEGPEGADTSPAEAQHA